MLTLWRCFAFYALQSAAGECSATTRVLGQLHARATGGMVSRSGMLASENTPSPGAPTCTLEVIKCRQFITMIEQAHLPKMLDRVRLQLIYSQVGEVVNPAPHALRSATL